MEYVWPIYKLSTEFVGSRRELVANVFTPPTRCNSTVASRRRRRCVFGIKVQKLYTLFSSSLSPSSASSSTSLLHTCVSTCTGDTMPGGGRYQNTATKPYVEEENAYMIMDRGRKRAYSGFYAVQFEHVNTPKKLDINVTRGRIS